MEIKLGFYGAAGNVTGSKYLLTANGRNILVDCGNFQEHDLKGRNWEKWPVNPMKIHTVLLTHGHLDHCGLLPKLVHDGFRGDIYCTEATADIAKIVMLDCARINLEDTDYKKKRHAKEGRKSPHPVIPLYVEKDVKDTVKLFKPWNQKRPLDLGHGISVEFIEVGHILGASSIRVTVTDGQETKRIVFSGDVGRWNMPILRDPSPVGEADYLLVESTYGNRQHGEVADIPGELAQVVNETAAKGGNLVIPSFAVERTQEMLFYLAELLKNKRIPHLKIYIDSPMATEVNKVFKRHPYLFDRKTAMLSQTMRLTNVETVRSTGESKALNYISGTAIIIAGSGMCTGGRIKHHLACNIGRPQSTILFIGYQASNTLGRIILNGAPYVRILGQEYSVKADIRRISGFSAHADRNELVRWMKTITNSPKKVFVVHGEPDASKELASTISQELGWEAEVPEYGQVVTL